MSLASQLQSSLQQALEKRGLPNLSGGPIFIRASGIGDCARKQTYIATMADQARPPQYYGMLQATQGNWIEDGMRQVIANAGYILDEGQQELVHEIDGKPIIVGHIDGLIREDMGALMTPWHLWECKGMSSFRYRKLVTAASVKAADPGYYDQVQVYMTLLNKSGTPVDSCLFTAIAKDPSAVNHPRNGDFLDPIYTEEIPWDSVYGDRLLKRAERIQGMADQGMLAERERDPNKDWDCSQRFCQFYQVCDPKRYRAKRGAA